MASEKKSINSLTSGYKKFYKTYFTGNKASDFEQLVSEGQSPKTIVIACSDSRVDPAILFNAEPGSLFVVRNVANLVPPFIDIHGYPQKKYFATSAALEFAVNFLKVENIVVLGHAKCGGIESVVNSSVQNYQDQDSFITGWMKIAHEPCQRILESNKELSLEEKRGLCEKECIKDSYHNLLTFPWIEDKVKRMN